MANDAKHKKNMVIDTGIYMLAKLIEGIVGIEIIRIYTKQFLSVDVGKYTKLNTAVQIGAGLLTIWLAQSMYRYFSKYKASNDLKKFYSTSLISWILINGVTILISMGLIFTTKDMWANNYRQIWMVLAIASFVLFNAKNILTTTLASAKESKYNLILSIVSAVGKLVSLIILVNFFANDISLIFVSSIVFDGIVSVLAVYKLEIYKHIKIKSFSKDIFIEFCKYGTPFIGSIFTTTLINNSDKYMLSNDYLAFYVVNYSIISTLFTMINTAVARGSVPTIMKVWGTGDKEYSYHLVAQTAKYYLMLIVPSVFGIYMISEKLSSVLFAKGYSAEVAQKYVQAHTVMVWVALALMFSFLAECSNKPFELNGKTKYIFRNSLVGGLSTLILNFIFIPKYGYHAAAITSFLGFFIYFILSKMGSRHYTKWRLGKSFYIKVVMSSGIMALLIGFLEKIGGTSIVAMLCYMCIAVVFYAGCMYYLGVAKNEINTIIKIIKHKFL